MGASVGVDRLGRRVEKAAREWTGIVPLRLELPNFAYFFMSGKGGALADPLSDVRNMHDTRSIVIGEPGKSACLQVSVHTHRKTSRARLKAGSAGDLSNLETSADFCVEDISPRVEPLDQDSDMVHEVMGWQPDEKHSELYIFNLGGSIVCHVQYFHCMQLADVKAQVARATGQRREAQHLSSLDKTSLQLTVLQVVDRFFPTGLRVHHVLDSERRVTRLAQIEHAQVWDVAWSPRGHSFNMSCDGMHTYSIQRTSGSAVGAGLLRTGTIDRQQRTAIAKKAWTDEYVAHANVVASNPNAMQTLFLGEVRLATPVASPDLASKTLLVALSLVLAGVDEERWIQQKHIEWAGASW